MGHVPFVDVEPTIKKRKVENVPTLPNSFQELEEKLRTTSYGKTWDGKPFYREIQTGFSTTGTVSFTNVLFHGENSQKFLKYPKIILLDATFKIVPASLHFYQLLTVMVIDNGLGIPVLFVLMTKKSQKAYEPIIDYVKHKLCLKPKIFLTDSELAISNSLRSRFPEVQQVSCYFHYAHAVTIQCLQLNLRPLARDGKGSKIFGYILALPLLPAGLIMDGYEVIENLIKELAKEDSLEEEVQILSEEDDPHQDLDCVEEILILDDVDEAREEENVSRVEENESREEENEAMEKENEATEKENETTEKEKALKTREGPNLLDFQKLLCHVFYDWIVRVGVKSLSVYRQPLRTTNFIESFHSTLMERHPSFWNFIELLKDIVKEADANMLSSEIGKTPKRPPKEGYVFNRLRQQRNEKELALGLITISEFLNRGKYQLSKLTNTLFASYRKKDVKDPLNYQSQDRSSRAPNGVNDARCIICNKEVFGCCQNDKCQHFLCFEHFLQENKNGCSHPHNTALFGPSSKQPSSKQPSCKEPSSKQPSCKEPSSKQPSTEQPCSKQTLSKQVKPTLVSGTKGPKITVRIPLAPPSSRIRLVTKPNDTIITDPQAELEELWKEYSHESEERPKDDTMNQIKEQQQIEEEAHQRAQILFFGAPELDPDSLRNLYVQIRDTGHVTSFELDLAEDLLSLSSYSSDIRHNASALLGGLGFLVVARMSNEESVIIIATCVVNFLRRKIDKQFNGM
ncbi:uncharacterized protein [Bemisia tabaci]|uniref:uncharacterized protein isoform X1 n=2 Tax=Bemisia tabaci TaxID=7038 RepID=UPI003B28679A